MRINREQFSKWIKALKSGRYKQTEGELQNECGYCCLGVACKVLIPKSKIELEEEEDIDGNTIKGKYLSGAFPNEQTYAPKWLKEINEDFAKKSENKQSLSVLNDEYHYTFKEIAEELEKVYGKAK